MLSASRFLRPKREAARLFDTGLTLQSRERSRMGKADWLALAAAQFKGGGAESTTKTYKTPQPRPRNIRYWRFWRLFRTAPLYSRPNPQWLPLRISGGYSVETDRVE